MRRQRRAAENDGGADESVSVSEPSSDNTTEPAGKEDNILIAYFSWSGNTEKMAQMIQSEIGGELFKIEPAEPYTDDYDTAFGCSSAGAARQCPA